MQSNAKSGTQAAAAGGAKPSLEQRAVEELKKYAVITLYLWVLFALFGLYKRMLLNENGISVWNQTFAIVNALIFGKVILIAQALDLGRRFEDRALIWIVLWRSFLFTLVLILFHVAEEGVRAWFERKPLSQAVVDFGGGTWFGFATYAAIFFVMLIPFFAFSEVARVVGGDALWKLLFRGEGRALRLVRAEVAGG